MNHNSLEAVDLIKVVYTAGRVFDGLRTTDLDTRSFLSTGNTDGIASKVDLHLLTDLKALALLAITHADEPVTAERLIALNAAITQSGPLHPGRLRTARQNIGVNTRHGRHEPPALTRDMLQRIVDTSLTGSDSVEQALALFVNVARAQPFEDGNKRTALFAANSLLIGSDTGKLLAIPYDEDDLSVSDKFNDLLARAYIFGEDDQVKALLREKGLTKVENLSS